jgi:predicted metalloprotease
MTCDTGYVLDEGKKEFVCSTGTAPTCKEDGVTGKVSDGGNSKTVIIVVVVVVVVLVVVGLAAVYYIRKKKQSSMTTNQAVRMSASKVAVEGENEYSTGENGYPDNVYDTLEDHKI